MGAYDFSAPHGEFQMPVERNEQGHVRVHRGVVVPRHELDNPDHFLHDYGVHWSTNEQISQALSDPAVYGEHDDDVGLLLSGWYDPAHGAHSEPDPITGGQFYNDHEQEITMPPGTPIHVDRARWKHPDWNHDRWEDLGWSPGHRTAAHNDWLPTVPSADENLSAACYADWCLDKGKHPFDLDTAAHYCSGYGEASDAKGIYDWIKNHLPGPHTAARLAMPAIDAYDDDDGVPVGERVDHQDVRPGPYFHSTQNDFPPGHVLVPRRELGMDENPMAPNHSNWVWMSEHPADAHYHAGAGAHIYEVEPLGEGPWKWNKHPDWDDTEDGGNRYVSTRARIIRKIEPDENGEYYNWTPHTAARLASDDHVTLYHHTTPQAAQRILDRGFSARRDHVFFSTKPHDPELIQYGEIGDTVLAVQVPRRALTPDDIQPKDRSVRWLTAPIDVVNQLPVRTHTAARLAMPDLNKAISDFAQNGYSQEPEWGHGDCLTNSLSFMDGLHPSFNPRLHRFFLPTVSAFPNPAREDLRHSESDPGHWETNELVADGVYAPADHYAPVINHQGRDHVVDWTMNQFDPHAKVPHIEPLDEYSKRFSYDEPTTEFDTEWKKEARIMTAAVTVYTKPDCPQCTMTKKQLDKLGIDHDTVDVTTDPDAHAYVTGLGYASAPVVVVNDGESHWSGFRDQKIRELAERFDQHD
jgi:glutaredoxin-like protein NrdH